MVTRQPVSVVVKASSRGSPDARHGHATVVPIWGRGSYRLSDPSLLPIVPVDDAYGDAGYDKIGKATERRLALGNFYVDETKLRRLIRNPERFISPVRRALGNHVSRLLNLG